MKTPLEFIWDMATDVGRLLSVLCLTMFGIISVIAGVVDMTEGSLFYGVCLVAFGMLMFILARLNADHYWKGK